jgi:integrase
MRGLTRDFSASTEDDEKRSWALRLLPRPLYRYESIDPNFLDGALCSLVTSAGTGPDALLILGIIMWSTTSLARFGPHAFRHACATHLLQEGLSLTEIGDHLGHRHLDTTRVYAKVDLAGLRQVADLDLGGLL